MTGLPAWLVSLPPETNLDLLHAKRGKACWKMGFACGAAIVVLDVPDDALGRADVVIALSSLSKAIEEDPVENPILPGVDSNPKGAQIVSRAQTSLALAEPPATNIGEVTYTDAAGNVVGASTHPPTDPAPPPDPEMRENEDGELVGAPRARGKSPKDCLVGFDLIGPESRRVELHAGDQVLRWEGLERPEWDTLGVHEMNRLAIEKRLRAVFASSVNQGVYCCRWRPREGEREGCFELLQGTGKRKPVK